MFFWSFMPLQNHPCPIYPTLCFFSKPKQKPMQQEKTIKTTSKNKKKEKNKTPNSNQIRTHTHTHKTKAPPPTKNCGVHSVLISYF